MNQRTRALSATADQVFSSASNGIFTFAVAVASTPRSFGQITLVITALVAVLGAQRGAVGTPLLLKSDQTTEQIRREGSYSLLAALAIGFVALGVILTFGYAVGLPAILLAVAAPIVLGQDILRYVAISEGRPHVAATWDGVWFLGTFALLVSAWLKLATAPWLIAGWAALGLIAFAGMAADFRMLPRLDGFGQWVKAGWQHRVRYGIDAGLEQTTVFLVLAMVATVLCPSATASLRGATVLLAPIGILAAALQLIVISESTRASLEPRTVWYAALRWLAGISVLTVVGGAALCSLPTSVGAYLLGQSFGPAQRVLPFMVVEYCATAVMFAIGIFLKTFNRSSDVMRLKIAFLVVTLASSTCAALLFRSASGVAAGLATGTTVVSSVALVYFAPWKAGSRASSVDITTGDLSE